MSSDPGKQIDQALAKINQDKSWLVANKAWLIPIAVNYYDWLSRHTRRRPPREHEIEDTQELAAPSEPIEVQELHASTTIIQRIRDALRDRLRGER